MSTLKVSSVQHASAASPAITLDANGQATLNGLAFPTSGSLSGRNRIINGDMRIDQRNAGAAVTVNLSQLFYGVDRWASGGVTSDGAFTIQQNTSAPAGFKTSTKITITTADASIGSTQTYNFQQRIEGYNIADLGYGAAGAQTITLSFWTRSSVTGTHGGVLINSGQDYSYPFAYSISAADTWEYKTITVAGPTAGTWLTDNGSGITVLFSVGAGSSRKGTAGTWSSSQLYSATGAVDLISTLSATFYITGVQLEVGTVATPFERRSYGAELSLCQRYYWRQNTPPVHTCYYAYQAGTSGFYTLNISTPVTMRAIPTISAGATNGSYSENRSTETILSFSNWTLSGGYGYINPNSFFAAFAEL